MHTKNHENCSQIECFMSQKPLAPKFLSQTVYTYTYINIYTNKSTFIYIHKFRNIHINFENIRKYLYTFRHEKATIS